MTRALAWIVRHWHIVVGLQIAANLGADVLAKRHHPVLAVLIWTVCACGWAVMLGSRVPFGRSIALNHVSSSVAAVLLAALVFHEPMTPVRWVGAVLGLVAIGLLA